MPIVGARMRRARSSAGEHYVDIVGVAGSIPAAKNHDCLPYQVLTSSTLWNLRLAGTPRDPAPRQ